MQEITCILVKTHVYDNKTAHYFLRLVTKGVSVRPKNNPCKIYASCIIIHTLNKTSVLLNAFDIKLSIAIRGQSAPLQKLDTASPFKAKCNLTALFNLHLKIIQFTRYESRQT